MATYTVRAGDSWSRIAGEVLGNQRFFEELQRANPGINILQPGMEIEIPDVSGISDPFVSAAPSPTGESNLFLPTPTLGTVPTPQVTTPKPTTAGGTPGITPGRPAGGGATGGLPPDMRGERRPRGPFAGRPAPVQPFGRLGRPAQGTRQPGQFRPPLIPNAGLPGVFPGQVLPGELVTGVTPRPAASIVPGGPLSQTPQVQAQAISSRGSRARGTISGGQTAGTGRVTVTGARGTPAEQVEHLEGARDAIFRIDHYARTGDRSVLPDTISIDVARELPQIGREGFSSAEAYLRSLGYREYAPGQWVRRDPIYDYRPRASRTGYTRGASASATRGGGAAVPARGFATQGLGLVNWRIG